MFLMKKSLILLLSGLNGQRSNKNEKKEEAAASDLGRRYTDLKQIALHYMPDFDERKVKFTNLLF